MTGRAVSKFSGVTFNASHNLRVAGNLRRIRGRMARCSTHGLMRMPVAPERQRPAARRGKLHPRVPRPLRIAHSATSGQPCFSSHPVKARISAIACAVDSAN